MTRAWFASAVVALLVVACDADESAFPRRNVPSEPGTEGTTPGADPTQPGSCAEGTPHVGFGGHDFVSDRAAGALGADRRRVKPYSALRTELARALGQTPAAMAASEAAYGEVPARWYAEPTAGAVSLYTTYSLSFTGCYDTMSGASFAAAPTAATAEAECARMQRKHWQRTPTPEETKACADLATTGLANEPAPRRRWAHACASILTSAAFTSY